MRRLDEHSLRRFLADNVVDLRKLSDAEFRDWLMARIEERQNDPVFLQKCRIREIERDHWPALRQSHERMRAWKRLCSGNERCEPIHVVNNDIRKLQLAVSGLRIAVAENRAKAAKLVEHERRLADRESERDALIATSHEYRSLESAVAEWMSLRKRIGLTATIEERERLEFERGRRNGRAGSSFEQQSGVAVDQLLLPELRSSFREDVEIVRLSGVTLGCPRGEFDHLAVRVGPSGVVFEVLAMIESKRNINDIGAGFRIRMENLAWLTDADRGYDPEQYKCQMYPRGRFDRPFLHEQDGRRFRFDVDSFRRSQRGWESFGCPLYFVTRLKPLSGVSTRELGSILDRWCRDVTLDLDNPTELRAFRQRAQDTMGPVPTRDVLEFYVSRGCADQIFVLDDAVPAS